MCVPVVGILCYLSYSQFRRLTSIHNMDDIRVICFDLDDTLWDLAPVIPRAEAALFAWYAEHYPRVTDNFSNKDIMRLRQSVAKENPDLKHDLTVLRMLTLQRVAVASGYAAGMAEEAFLVFQEVRNRVELYADVLPGLRRLGEHYRLVTLSNGNADLSVIGIDSLFETGFSARKLGFAKPDTRIFAAMCTQLGVSPGQVVHVGDHPQNDIAAAQQAGMPAVWINRTDNTWPLDDEPEHVVGCLEELADVFIKQVSN
jgi:2-haloalkanoic acid dehalogenase type II